MWIQAIAGQLTFAVFNAEPATIYLKRGQPIFLIWYASLDRESTFKKDGSVHMGIDAEVITGIAGELQSLAGLAKKMKDVDGFFSRPPPLTKGHGCFSGGAAAKPVTVTH